MAVISAFPMGMGSGGNDASIAAYTVTLPAASWVQEVDKYKQSVAVATATALDTNVAMITPADGALDWKYGIEALEKGSGTVTFTAAAMPVEDLIYDISVLNVEENE